MDRSNISAFLYTALYLLIPNAFFWVICNVLSVERPLINLDYLLVAACLFLPSRWPAIIAFCIFFIIDVLALVSQIYVFANIEHLYYLSNFVSTAPTVYQFYIASVFIFLALLLYLLPVTRKKASLAITLIALNLGIVAYAIENKLVEVELNTVRLIKNKIVGSPSVHTLNTRTTKFFQSHNEKSNSLFPTTEKVLSQELHDGMVLPDQLLLVINESWGIHLNPDIQGAIIKPLTDLYASGAIVNLAQGSAGFSGATVEAELKELCQTKTDNFNLRIIETGFENCLPNKLANNGYFTQSLHSASGILYDRIHWYSLAGFQSSLFFENLEWTRRCYSYPGGCDFEAINQVAESFTKHKKLFFYWLTLNSHAIYDRRDIILNEFDCSFFDINENTQTCRNLILQHQFFSILANSIKEGSFTGAKVLIVSDHTPIITNIEEKQANFKPAEIPWISFNVAKTAMQLSHKHEQTED